MSRSRMFADDAPGDADNMSPRRTIVGGRPPEAAGPTLPVPTGIQRLLRMAALDGAFLDQLLARRGEVAAAARVELTATEAAILRAIPAEQFVPMARNMPPPESARRELLRQSAATAVVPLGGAALAACEACGPVGPAVAGGSRPDIPPEPPPPPYLATQLYLAGHPEHSRAWQRDALAAYERAPDEERREVGFASAAARHLARGPSGAGSAGPLTRRIPPVAARARALARCVAADSGRPDFP